MSPNLNYRVSQKKLQFMMSVANFEPLYLRHLGVETQRFCAHLTGTFLDFTELIQLLSVGEFDWHIGAFKN